MTKKMEELAREDLRQHLNSMMSCHGMYQTDARVVEDIVEIIRVEILRHSQRLHKGSAKTADRKTT